MSNASREFSELYELAFSWDSSIESGWLDLALATLNPPRPLRIIDVGAGTGRFALTLASRSSTYEAVEPDPAMRKILKRTLERTFEPGSNPEIHCNIADIKESAEFTLFVFMTDVLSYIYPAKEFDVLFESMQPHINGKGAVIIDIALWNDDELYRSEEWDSPTPDGQIHARCEAKRSPYNLNERTETIQFSLKDVNGSKIARQQNLLHAFSANKIIETFKSRKLDYVCAVSSSGVHINDIKEFEKRAIICFKAEGVIPLSL